MYRIMITPFRNLHEVSNSFVLRSMDAHQSKSAWMAKKQTKYRNKQHERMVDTGENKSK